MSLFTCSVATVAKGQVQLHIILQDTALLERPWAKPWRQTKHVQLPLQTNQVASASTPHSCLTRVQQQEESDTAFPLSTRVKITRPTPGFHEIKLTMPQNGFCLRLPPYIGAEHYSQGVSFGDRQRSKNIRLGIQAHEASQNNTGARKNKLLGQQPRKGLFKGCPSRILRHRERKSCRQGVPTGWCWHECRRSHVRNTKWTRGNSRLTETLQKLLKGCAWCRSWLPAMPLTTARFSTALITRTHAFDTLLGGSRTFYSDV